MPEEVDPPLAAAILAGGRARRMGGANKAALQVGERRIIDRQIELLRLVADPVFVVSSRQDTGEGLGVDVVHDRVPEAGSLGGIYTAILASPRSRTLVVACDMPFLTRALVERLARPSRADLVIPRSPRGLEPLCATWAAACAAPIGARIALGLLQASAVAEELHVEEVGPEILAGLDPDGLLFMNVNTPHDYERARELSRLEKIRRRIVS